MSGETDSLQFLPMERWGELEDAFKADWPRGISGYSALRTQRELSDRGLDYGFKVYCPYGNVSSGMVAFNKKGTLNEIIIQCPRDDTSNLVKALISTNLVDWRNRILVPFMPHHILQSVRSIADQLNLEIEAEDTEPNELVLLPKDTALFHSLPSNADLTVKLLSKDHIAIVDSTWRNRYDGSLWFFDMLSKAGHGYGLFLKAELVSWVFVSEVGALTHLFTLEEQRNKGYAEILLKSVCNVCQSAVSADEDAAHQSTRNHDHSIKVETSRNDTFNEIIIHSPTLDTTQLENALVSTKLIDWSDVRIVPCLPPHTHAAVRRAADRLGLRFTGEDKHSPHDLVLFDIHKLPFENVQLPDDVTFQSLSEEHANVVDVHWPNRYEGSEWIFRLLIKNNSSYGLFKNKELVAWVFVNEIGALVHLYTLENHRKKGYAKLIMQLLCNKYLEAKKPVFGYCKRGNVIALKLYESLGFEQFYYVLWTTLKKE